MLEGNREGTERRREGRKQIYELDESITVEHNFCKYCVIMYLIRNLFCYTRECAILQRAYIDIYIYVYIYIYISIFLCKYIGI